MIPPPNDAFEVAIPNIFTCIDESNTTQGIVIQTFNQSGWIGRVECRYKTGEVSGYLTNNKKQVFCVINGDHMDCDKITWGHKSYIINPVPSRMPK